MGEIVAQIDQAALAEKRSITVPLVAQVLDAIALDRNFG
jgi:hypothetical protein